MAVTETPVSRQSEEPAIRLCQSPGTRQRHEHSVKPTIWEGLPDVKTLVLNVILVALAAVLNLSRPTVPLASRALSLPDVWRASVYQQEVRDLSRLPPLPFRMFEMYYPVTESI
jgi:hypothetical protein